WRGRRGARAALRQRVPQRTGQRGAERSEGQNCPRPHTPAVALEQGAHSVADDAAGDVLHAVEEAGGGGGGFAAAEVHRGRAADQRVAGVDEELEAGEDESRGERGMHLTEEQEREDLSAERDTDHRAAARA